MAGRINDRESVIEPSEDLQANGPGCAPSDLNGFVDGQDESLREAEVSRNPRVESAMQRNHAANRLAAANRTNRLLRIALILSILAHVVVPIYLVIAMTKPEKVALMDGTPSVL